jgi:hypothetical protein
LFPLLSLSLISTKFASRIVKVVCRPKGYNDGLEHEMEKIELLASGMKRKFTELDLTYTIHCTLYIHYSYVDENVCDMWMKQRLMLVIYHTNINRRSVKIIWCRKYPSH